MYAMAPDIERTAKTAPKPKLLTMDVIELTLLLKSIGFRLDSIDYDELRSWGKKMTENGTGRADADHHSIDVQISCSKSKIVSHLSFKLNENEIGAAAATDPVKSMACSCPKREPRSDNNSFWEVQSSGTFANQRRSINALISSEKGIDHDTSSNLLPPLSTKSIALTHVLTQVLLNQYKSNTQFGDSSSAKDVDIKSIMEAIKSTSAHGKNASPDQIEELNLITPMSSMNTSPTDQEGLINVTAAKVTFNGEEFAKNAALNETVSTEAFSSPKSLNLVTSSPHVSVPDVDAFDRDSNLFGHLNTARLSIDKALLSIKLNVTRNLTQDLHDDFPMNRSTAPLRLSNSRVSVNARPTSAMNRRASIGSTATGRVPSKTNAAISTRPAAPARKSIGALPTPPASTSTLTSKLSMVRRAVSSIGSRATETKGASGKTPPLVKRPSLTRRPSNLSATPNATPPGSSIARKTTSTIKLPTSSSKLAKK